MSDLGKISLEHMDEVEGRKVDFFDNQFLHQLHDCLFPDSWMSRVAEISAH